MNHMHGLGREFEIRRKGLSTEKDAEERKTQEHRDENERLQEFSTHGYSTIGYPSAEGNWFDSLAVPLVNGI